MYISHFCQTSAAEMLIDDCTSVYELEISGDQLVDDALVLYMYPANSPHNSFSLDVILKDFPPGPLSSQLPMCAGSDLHQR